MGSHDCVVEIAANAMKRFPHLAQRLFNVPLAIHPDKAEIVMAALADVSRAPPYPACMFANHLIHLLKRAYD